MTNATRLTLVTDAHRSAISRNLSTISIQASPGVSVICHTGRIHGTTAEIPSLFPAIGKACILRLNVSYHWRERRDLLADGYSHAARLADQWPAKPFVVVRTLRRVSAIAARQRDSPRPQPKFRGKEQPLLPAGEYRLPDYGTGNDPYRRIRLGEFALEVIGVHHPLVHVLVRGEGTGLAEQLATSMILPWSTWTMMAMLRIGRSDMGKA